ncbi:MAG: hypothetical protein K2W96_25610 [Gemmataceae bacterium]|nr:hypothetical protein [Gemmataceae bacterium]
MRYFTQELLARCRSSDEAAAQAASDEWDAATLAHDEAFARIGKLMPARARKALSKHSLHDSTMIMVAVRRSRIRSAVSMYVRLEAGEVVEFKYACPITPGLEAVSLKPPTMHDPRRGQGNTRILYDEVGQEGDRLFSHSILLANGSEARIVFADMTVARVGYADPGRLGHAHMGAVELETALS